jgi:hypothetical protein
MNKHKTQVVSTPWDVAHAILEAKTQEELTYMHAYLREGSDATKRESYLFPHHEAGTDTPANLHAVNLALVRVSEAKIPDAHKFAVMAHLRAHRVDAGLSACMNDGEIQEAVKHIKKMDDLKIHEAKALTDQVVLQERSNMAEWLESRLHLTLTQFADDMFGGGRVTRNERKALSGAIGEALDSYHNFLTQNAPQLFKRAPWDDAPDENGDQPLGEALGTERAVVQDVALEESAIALQEKAVRSDGTVPVKIIQPGWGSSGWYSKEVLQRDGAKAFPKGTKMLWNHPTVTEEAERPEGDLNDLASELVSDARWMDNGPKGPGLYADAKVFESYQAPINDLAPHIGVSIHARGKGMFGTAEGKEGVIVQEILESPFNRVDYVTMPGAGGAIISLFEAVRTVRTDNKTKTGAVPATVATHNVADTSNLEEQMADEKLNERVATLETTNQTLATANARLAEALALRDAKDMVKEALASIVNLPDITKARLIESLSKNPPMKEGVLDREAFTKAIQEAVKSEVKYLESVLGKGQIRGLGESTNDDAQEETPEKLEESLAGSFAALGLSETAAKIAAKGRE